MRVAVDPQTQAERDLELMTGVARGDEASISALYDRFGALVYRMAVQTMPTREEAEDAVQEVFIRLWRTAEKYDPQKAALITWVMLLTRRHLVDKLRRTRARVRTSTLDDGFTPRDQGTGASEPLADAQEREKFDSLMKKVEQLPDLQRTVIVRAYLGGQTLRQISQELETPLGTVKSALSRALVRLRERSAEEPS